MSRARGWCFTLNNYTQEEEEKIKQIDCKYLVFGHEHTKPGEGTPHLQGFIFFKNQKTMQVVKKLIGDRAHLETMKGNSQQAADYCKKEGVNIFEKGERPLTAREATSKAGKKHGEIERDEWADMIKHAEDQDLEWIKETYPECYLRHEATFERIKNRARKEENMDLDNAGLREHFLWLWGPTGSGKSHTSREIAKKISPDEEPYLKDWNKWWNGYTGQKVTIIDEASPERLEHLTDFLKKWADKWTFTAEVKGSSYNAIRPEYIIITSNYSMEQCLPRTQDLAALKRRFTEIEKYDKEQAVDWPMQTNLQKEAANEEASHSDAARGNTETLAASEQSINSLMGEPVEEVPTQKRQRDDYLAKCIEANLKFKRLQ